MPTETQTISFRVPAHIAGRLEAAGAELRLSKNEYARELVIKALSAPSLHDVVAGLHQLQETTNEIAREANANGAPRAASSMHDSAIDELSAKLDRLDEAIAQLAKSHAKAVTALLVEAGKLNLEDAKRWVARYVKKSPPNQT